jgi:hypothetical protein
MLCWSPPAVVSWSAATTRTAVPPRSQPPQKKAPMVDARSSSSSSSTTQRGVVFGSMILNFIFCLVCWTTMTAVIGVNKYPTPHSFLLSINPNCRMLCHSLFVVWFDASILQTLLWSARRLVTASGQKWLRWCRCPPPPAYSRPALLVHPTHTSTIMPFGMGLSCFASSAPFYDPSATAERTWSGAASLPRAFHGSDVMVRKDTNVYAALVFAC